VKKALKIIIIPFIVFIIIGIVVYLMLESSQMIATADNIQKEIGKCIKIEYYRSAGQGRHSSYCMNIVMETGNEYSIATDNVNLHSNPKATTFNELENIFTNQTITVEYVTMPTPWEEKEIVGLSDENYTYLSIVETNKIKVFTHKVLWITYGVCGLLYLIIQIHIEILSKPYMTKSQKKRRKKKIKEGKKHNSQMDIYN